MANAITGNPQPNPNRSNVGLIIFYSYENGKLMIDALSSSVLISSNKLLTTAHAIVSEKFYVTFDMQPNLIDKVSGGFTFDNLQTKYTGTAIINSEFSTSIRDKNGAPFFETHDVALITLSTDVPPNVVSKYAVLPSAGYVNELSPNSAVELVGYGVQEHLTPRNSGIEKTWIGTLARNSAESKIISGNFAWSDEFIRCSANPGQGKGGIAFGDSGGPVFLKGTNTLLALNSYVTNPNCVGETYHTRLDLTDIIGWIENPEVHISG